VLENPVFEELAEKKGVNGGADKNSTKGGENAHTA